ncbi:hypothetical protein L3Q82_025686, partial [Scortum barcoo]
REPDDHSRMSAYNCSYDNVMSDKVKWLYPPGEKCVNLTSSMNDSHIGLEDVCLTDDQYLEKYRGPRRSPVFLPVCLTYLVIFIVGVVGNVLTCTVIARNKVMWTPTNYYLFSLAVSDLLVLLLGMPLELYELWENYPFLLGKGGCYFKTFLLETVCLASILNVTALSVERYIAVVHPATRKVCCNAHPRQAGHPHGVGFFICPGGNMTVEIPNSAICTMVKSRWMYNLTIQVTTLLFFILPMLTISVLYMLIGLQLKREKMRQALEAKTGFGQDTFCNIRSQQQKTRRRQVTKMLFVLVVVFVICWAPFHTDRLMWSFISEWTDSHRKIFEFVHIVSGVFFYLSSAVNPILYNLMSTRFREMFKEVMCHRPHHITPRKHSLSVTRVTLRSTLSDAPHSNGAAVMEAEAEDGEVRVKDETGFSC